MKEIFKYGSVHYRIARLLRTRHGEWIDCDLIEFVANFEDYQTDWRRRLRELRSIGFQIESKTKRQGKRTISYYRLTRWIELPWDGMLSARLYDKGKS